MLFFFSSKIDLCSFFKHHFPPAELAICTETPTDWANAGTETQPLTAKMKTKTVQSNLRPLRSYALFNLKDNSLFHLFFSLKSRFTLSFAMLSIKVIIYYLSISFIITREKINRYHPNFLPAIIYSRKAIL